MIPDQPFPLSGFSWLVQTQFRLQRLEEKVDRHNSVIERTFKLEGRMTEVEHDIRDLKGSARV